MLKIRTVSGGEADLFPPDGILKAECLQRLQDARQIETAARSKAAKVLRRAREQGRQIRRKARIEGYAEGLREFSEAVKQFGTAHAELELRLESLLRRGLQGVLRRVPKEDWLSAALQDIAADLPGEGDIIVMAHPVNMRPLAAAIASLKQHNQHFVPLRPEPNPQMQRDECLIYAGMEVIDISVPVMVEEIIAALKISQPLGGHHEEARNESEVEDRSDHRY